MYYKYKLLKDLPNHKAGTVFDGNDHRYSREVVFDNERKETNCLNDILNNPEWVEKTPDDSELTDFSCECGSTKGCLVWDKETHSEWDDDYRGVRYYKLVYLECVCGNKKKLFRY